MVTDVCQDCGESVDEEEVRILVRMVIKVVVRMLRMVMRGVFFLTHISPPARIQ